MKDDSLSINTLALNNCLCHRKGLPKWHQHLLKNDFMSKLPACNNCGIHFSEGMIVYWVGNGQVEFSGWAN